VFIAFSFLLYELDLAVAIDVEDAQSGQGRWLALAKVCHYLMYSPIQTVGGFRWSYSRAASHGTS
jgi:hypothetical protein